MSSRNDGAWAPVGAGADGVGAGAGGAAPTIGALPGGAGARTGSDWAQLRDEIDDERRQTRAMANRCMRALTQMAFRDRPNGLSAREGASIASAQESDTLKESF